MDNLLGEFNIFNGDLIDYLNKYFYLFSIKHMIIDIEYSRIRIVLFQEFINLKRELEIN